jgi:LPXTG-motif cell wall-anchored protein
VLKVSATDKAGNKTELEYSFVIDKTNPVIKVEGVENNGLYNSEVEVKVTVDDTDAIVTKSLTLNGEPVEIGKLAKEGTYVLKVSAVDKAGNKTELEYSFVIDKTAPAVTVEGVETNKVYTNMSITPTIKSEEGAVLTITLDGSAYDGKEPIKSLGAHTIKIVVVDKAGNKSETVISFTIEVATTPEGESADIIRDLINNSKPDDKIVVKASENPVVTSEVLEAIKGIDRTISFKLESQGMELTWTVNGKDITDTNASVDLRLNEVAPNEAAIVKLDTNAQILSFKNHGTLPAKSMVVTVPVDPSKIDVNKPIYLYYYNETTKEVTQELKGLVAYKVGDKYFVDITLTHNSDFFLSSQSEIKQTTDVTQPGGQIPQTGSPVDMSVLVVLGIILIAIGCYVLVIRRRKTE